MYQPRLPGNPGSSAIAQQHPCTATRVIFRCAYRPRLCLAAPKFGAYSTPTSSRSAAISILKTSGVRREILLRIRRGEHDRRRQPCGVKLASRLDIGFDDHAILRCRAGTGHGSLGVSGLPTRCKPETRSMSSSRRSARSTSRARSARSGPGCRAPAVNPAT